MEALNGQAGAQDNLKTTSVVPGDDGAVSSGATPGGAPTPASNGNGTANPKTQKDDMCMSTFPPPLISGLQLTEAEEGKIDALVKKNTWDTNVFLLNSDELVLFLEALYEDLGLVKEFNIPKDKLRTFLLTMRESYHEENSYHNFFHAVDVASGVRWLVKNTGAGQHINRLEILALFTGAIGHDVDHPGTTNSFQVNILSKIALQHNNRSVLENHHLNVLLSVLRTDGADILAGLHKDQRAQCINNMVDNVLATDIMRHFDFSAQLTTKIMSGSPFNVDRIDDRKLVTMATLKLADISNASKEFDVAQQWADRVLEEFWQQGDREIALGIPVSPQCDRETTDFDISQVSPLPLPSSS